MEYFTLLTQIGAQKIAAATAANTTVALAEIALGDGNGTVPMPDASKTALVNEVYRAPLNDLRVDENNANWLVAEGYVPSDEGNFWVREVGVFDNDGDLIIIGNYPETFKPITSNGVAKDLYMKVITEVSSGDAVALSVDPSVVMASQEFVNERLKNKAEKVYVDEELSKLSFQTGFKNLIINGCLRVNQRGATAIDETASAYNFDRWYYDGTNFIQYIENKNIVLSGTYTLSWVGAATATVNGASVSNGGQVTLTANTQCEVKFDNSDFSFVQLEYGNKKTNFEIRPYILELNLCKRYFIIFKAYMRSQITSGDRGYHINFDNELRIIPSVIRISDHPYGTAAPDFYIKDIYKDGIYLQGNHTYYNAGVYSADAEIYPV